jgi:hypothetical protein
MTPDELKSDLRAILAAEEAAPADWARVESMSLATIKRLNGEAEPDYPHDVIYHYLDDFDVRRIDDVYGRGQRAWLKSWLSSAQ